MAVLINGDGRKDISAQNEAEFYAGIVGDKTVVLNSGNQMKAEIVTNNQVKLHDGELISQGRRIQIPAGTSDEFTIENGSQGAVRYDILGYRFFRDESGNENVEMFVQKDVGEGGVMEEASIREGATECFIGVYRAKLNGLTLEALEPLFTILTPMDSNVIKIVESGTKYGVHYEKRSDGVMRMWSSGVAPSIVLNKGDGYMVYGEEIANVFPFSFTDVPNIHVTMQHSSVALFAAIGKITKSDFSFWPYGVKTATAASPRLCWEAVGHWK